MTSPVIVFRADASIDIGTGHVMRCLTLADALRARGASCRFICRPHLGHLIGLIVQRGHEVIALTDTSHVVTSTAAYDADDVQSDYVHWLGVDWATDARDTISAIGAEPVDWLVVDHYALDARWEQCLRHACKQVMVIDDLADRPHDCDLLLDQNLGHTEQDYAGLTSVGCKLLIGPLYSLLRPEFAALRAYSLARRIPPQFKRMLITMGGVDKGNCTGQVLDALSQCTWPAGVELTIVMGPHAPWLDQVRQQASAMSVRCKVLVGVENMAQLMADADLAIGAAGSTAWERCCLGLPTVAFVLAPNQLAGAVSLQQKGAIVLTQSMADLPLVIQSLLTGTEEGGSLLSMVQAALRITNGLGTTQIADNLGIGNA